MIPLTLTPAAARRLRFIQEHSAMPAVRIALKKGGCAGMEYTMEPIAEIPARAQKIEQDGAVLVVDPLAEMFLLGTEIDYTSSLLESTFVFRNPNVSSACGCGASVSFGS